MGVNWDSGVLFWKDHVAIKPDDGHHELYRDNREARTFCPTSAY